MEDKRKTVMVSTQDSESVSESVSVFVLQNWRHSSSSRRKSQMATLAGSPPFREKPPGGGRANFERAHYLK